MTPLQQLEQVGSPDFSLVDAATVAPPRTLRQVDRSSTGLQKQTAKPQHTIRIALAGCGVVGGSLVRLLHDSASSIASRFGVRFVITRVLVRDTTRERRLPIESRLFTNDLETFLAQDADVVIEAVGGDEPARTIAITALRRGQKLITANKELIASHGADLDVLAIENRTALDFGAAVGGSAPIISTLRDLVGASAPRSIRGILNGTSNFVLSQLERGVPLDDAVVAARERGLAEADCARDLDGRDSAAKLAIIGWIAFGIRPSALNLRRLSLLPRLEELVRAADRVRGRVRLLGECTRIEGNRVVASVEPVVVPVSSAFARTINEENRVEVDLGWSSALSVSGPGAGGAPTAAALLSDLVRVSAPPNDRGKHATQFVSVPDTRRHSWLIGARLERDQIESLAAGADLPAAEFFCEGDSAYLVTEPIPWERAQGLLCDLERLGRSPCIARYEVKETSEAVQ
jgi:homoserine dehydrogenase